MSNGAPQRQKYKRRQYLVDRAFQLKYTIIIAIIGALIAVFWGTLFFKASKENAEQVMLALKVDPELQTLSEKVEEKLSGEDKRIVASIGGFVLAVLISLSIWGVLITHRVAGPLFIISRYFDTITDGKYPDPRPLRKNDELKVFFTKFNAMLTAVKERERSDVIALERAVETASRALPKMDAEGAEAVGRALEELKKLQEAKLAMLKGQEGPQGAAQGA
jgi:hypothetical protein